MVTFVGRVGTTVEACEAAVQAPALGEPAAVDSDDQDDFL
jgi:hypothetical protein